MSSSSLDVHSKRSRKIYPGSNRVGEFSNKQKTRLRESGNGSLDSSPNCKLKPQVLTSTSRKKQMRNAQEARKIHPTENSIPTTYPLNADFAESKCHSGSSDIKNKLENKEDSSSIENDTSNNNHVKYTAEGERAIPFRKSLKPLDLSKVSKGSGLSKKNKKLLKSESKKKLKTKPASELDNIDSRIEMELSQSSSESNINVDSKKRYGTDVVNNIKVEEAKVADTDIHHKVRVDTAGNKRHQRQHHVDLKTLTRGTVDKSHELRPGD